MFRSKTLTLLILILISIPIYSQSSAGMSSKMLQMLDLETDLGSGLPSESIPSANEIDPDNYYLAQGDVLSILLIPQNQKEIEVQVYPDNTIILPKLNIGINVKGKTLTEISDSISFYSQKINSQSKVFVSLKTPKQAIVTIRGNVESPGVYTLPGSMTIASVLRIGNKLEINQPISLLEQQQEYMMNTERKMNTKRFETFGVSPDKSYWRRNVSVLHSEGSSSYLDLELGKAQLSVKDNPYVQPGDIISVPYDKSSYPTIAIYGEVIRPIELPYKNGDMASFLWKFGGGLTMLADRDKLRYYSPSGKEKVLVVDNEGNLIEDFEIQPGSSIVVPEVSEPTVDKTPLVAVKGEVNKPGYYPISKDMGLDDVIELAGGLSERAYLPLGYINRRSLDDENFDIRMKYLESFNSSDLTLEDTTRYNIDFMTKKPIVALDFIAAAKGKVGVEFIDGDVVVIPENPQRVYVFGRVHNPGFVKFEKSMLLQDFLDNAGGITEIAEEDRIRIIRGNTNVWVDPDENPEIFAGDQIYVPGSKDIPILAEQQQNAFYVGVAQASILLVNVLFGIFSQ